MSDCCHLQAEEADEKERALVALTYAKDPILVQRTLQYALGPDVRAQDTPTVILGVASRGGKSLQAAWAFLRTYAVTLLFPVMVTFRSPLNPLHRSSCIPLAGTSLSQHLAQGWYLMCVCCASTVDLLYSNR